MQEWYNTLARTQNRSAETVSSTYKRQINNNSPYYQNQQGYVQNAPNQHQQVVYFAIMIFPVPEILNILLESTLRPSGTLLFSGLPMMI